MSTHTHRDKTAGCASGMVMNEIVQLQLEASNASQLSYPVDICVPQLVEKQSAVTPDALALVEGDYTLSYKELNQRANQLAHYLQTLGVKPNKIGRASCRERV